MMNAATLKPPKTGRSRFSKALPEPPSLPTFEFEQSYLSPQSASLSPSASEKALPRLQPEPEAPLPPLPPPKGLGEGPGLGISLEKEWDRATIMTTTTTVKPLDSPLPPLPPAPKPMSIPRRPVPARVVSPPPSAAPVPVAPPAPTPAPALVPPPTLGSPNPPLSPVGSISSLLSAYSNHTADADPTPRSSLSNSTKDVASSRQANSVVSPNPVTQHSSTSSDGPSQPSPRPPPEQHAPTHGTNGRPSLERPLTDFPPPPPLKDARRPQTPTSLQSDGAQAHITGQMGSPSKNTSPQQDQLWRRRSLKADKNFAVPDLKLVSSHGSTAASAQNSSLSGPGSSLSQPLPTAPPTHPETLEPTKTLPAPPPRSADAGLPGRDIRPVPVSDRAAPQKEASMGQEASRIKGKLGSERRRESDGEAKASAPEVQGTTHSATTTTPTSVASVPTVSQPSSSQLPTPEYGTDGVKSPLLTTAVSPLSPASTSELTSTVPRKPVGPVENQLRPAKSTPSLAAEARNPGLTAQSAIGLPKSPRPDRGTGQTSVPPPTSRNGEDTPLNLAVPRRDATSFSDSPNSQSRDAHQRHSPHEEAKKSVSEAGSVETVKPAQPSRRPDYYQGAIEEQTLLPLREPDPDQATTTDNPGAALFPRNWYTPRPADEILDPRPLTDIQFRCLTNHRYMTANRQRTNPIGCRTCGHKDRNAEAYICSSCYLNVCSGCTGLLRRHRGDLRAVLREIEEKKAEAAVKTATMNGSATATILEE
ncbi:hypothetical protein VTK26DRAFT_1939 [Humicola hyalothermophila]